MNFGKTLSAQFMEFVPWTNFARIKDRNGGDLSVRNQSCTEQFRAPVKRSTLADVNEARNWHILEELAMLLIWRARKLYCNNSFGVDLTNMVFALDASTISLRLSIISIRPHCSRRGVAAIMIGITN